ncbi:MAG: glycosyltransferase family 2 protein [Pseudomonadota bacterium]
MEGVVMRQADEELDAPANLRVTVGLCTRNRPADLDACLKSLRDLTVPEGWDVTFVVVDNSPRGNALPAIQGFAAAAPGAVRSVHVTAPGLVAARNAMLEEALATAPDWIMILDDDELVGPGWLEAYAAFIEQFPGFDIVTGPVDPIFPDPRPFWAVLQQPAEPPEGTRIFSANTHNVAMRAALVSEEGAALRFDPAYNLSGGEDADFFLRASAAGARIGWTSRVRLWETRDRSRLSLAYQLGRNFRTSANNIIIRRRLGLGLSGLGTVGKGCWRVLSGSMLFAISPFALALGPTSFKWVVLRGGRRATSGAGLMFGLFNSPRRYYEDPSG